MKIGVFSDTHLGFDSKGERYSESFENLEQAIELCTANNSDLMVLCGDVFDAPIPSHDSLYRAIGAFSRAKKRDSEVKLLLEKSAQKQDLHFSGTPIITIHGNHEYAGREAKTALDVLNASNLLIYLHAGKIVVQKGSERACIFGLGAVPEKKALDVLRYWNPQPEKNCANLLLLHQGFKEFMAVDDEMVATLSLDELPAGFDLVIDGHIHWHSEQKLGNMTFLIAGSTISTSIKKLEADQRKGVYFFDTDSKELSFKEFTRQRRSFYFKIVFSEADAPAVVLQCRKHIEEALLEKHGLKPLIRLNLKGSLKKGLAPSEVNLSPLLDEYSKRCIISLSKNFADGTFKRRVEDLRELQKSRLSVVSLGFDLLEKNLLQTDFGSDFSARELFELLADDDIDGALAKITKQ